MIVIPFNKIDSNLYWGWGSSVHYTKEKKIYALTFNSKSNSINLYTNYSEILELIKDTKILFQFSKIFVLDNIISNCNELEIDTKSHEYSNLFLVFKDKSKELEYKLKWL